MSKWVILSEGKVLINLTMWQLIIEDAKPLGDSVVAQGGTECIVWKCMR